MKSQKVHDGDKENKKCSSPIPNLVTVVKEERQEQKPKKKRLQERQENVEETDHKEKQMRMRECQIAIQASIDEMKASGCWGSGHGSGTAFVPKNECQDVLFLPSEQAVIVKEEVKEGSPTSPSKKNWICCDRCEKWREIPLEILETLNPADPWSCTMNLWDDEFNTCEKPEAAQEEHSEDDSSGNEDGETEEDLKYRKKQELLDAKREETRVKQRVKEREELEIYIASLSESDITQAKLQAKKKNGKKKQLPIHLYPSMFADKKAAKMLRRDLYFGADIDAQDYQGRTALHYSYTEECPIYRDVLLECGAEPYVCDNGERAPHELEIFRPKKCMWDKFI